jgi:putative DNA-invertase from lambdoid prophage Rac
MAATAEAQAEATEPHSYRGRKPSFDRARLDIIHNMLAQEPQPDRHRGSRGGNAQAVYRVQGDPAKAEAMLAEWDCSWRHTHRG